MISYTTLGTNDLPRAAAYDDELFAVLGAKRLMDFGRGHAWGVSMSQPMFGVMLPFDGKAAAAGNGTMVALIAPDRTTVDAMHAKALAMGSVDEGATGPRGEGFYAAYFRDLDGNKLNVCFLG
jgi:catechol 2,3-dioxygenase-like lactoylglutathione lyase family enzyme